MCGLIAAISKLKSGFMESDLQKFQLGLYSTAIRGIDSTGCFLVTKEGNVDLIKDKQESADFIRTEDFSKFLLKAYQNSRIIVGHCRAATKGEKTAENAHPFISEHIALVHNGTLFNHKQFAQTTTDSEAIAVALSKENPEELLPDLYGAYALIWYNAKEKTFHVSRNSERPLWILQTSTTDYIGSEPELLQWIVNRGNKKKEIASFFKEDTIYSWKLDKISDDFEETELKKKPFYPTTMVTPAITACIVIDDLKIPYGEIVQLKTKAKTVIYDTFYLTATCDKYPGVIFKCFMGNSKDLKDTMEDIQEFSATVSGKQKVNNEQFTVVVSSPKIITNTISSILLLEDLTGKKHYVDVNNTRCSKCFKLINKYHDQKLWFRVKNHRLKNVTCPDCISENLKKGISND